MTMTISRSLILKCISLSFYLLVSISISPTHTYHSTLLSILFFLCLPPSPSQTFTLTADMVKITVAQEKISSRKYVPSVIEPSFGIGRILYALIEHAFWTRPDDAQKKVRSLFSCPYQYSDFSLYLFLFLYLDVITCISLVLLFSVRIPLCIECCAMYPQELRTVMHSLSLSLFLSFFVPLCVFTNAPHSHRCSVSLP